MYLLHKKLFLARFGSAAHLDTVFADRNETAAQEHALYTNANVQRRHVEIGQKSGNRYTRRAAFLHPHSTDQELRGAWENEYNNTDRLSYASAMNKRGLL